jgi:RNA polymerase sigma-70 factor (ECF subfamily)
MDLTADTFAQAFAGRRRFRGGTDAAARSWLNTIAVRQFNRYLRRGYADRRMIERLRLERFELTVTEQQFLEAASAYSGTSDVMDALEGVSDDLRIAAQLRFIEDMPYSEIARRLAITETAARMRVSRALQLMRVHLDPNFERGPL